MSEQVTHAQLQPDVAPYVDLLDRAMADLHLDLDEEAALLAIAHKLGLDATQIRRAHDRWLKDLMATACADGVVDNDEYDQLLRAAHVLGIDDKVVHDHTVGHRTASSTLTLAAGLAVCFTGEATDDCGRHILREDLEDHAQLMGLVVEEEFTKSRCHLLVAADPNTQSGKAGKARGWNIPIISVSDFLATAPGAEITSHVIAVGGRQAASCPRCGQPFTREARGKKQLLCAECMPPLFTVTNKANTPAVTSATAPVAAVPTSVVSTRTDADSTVMETLRRERCDTLLDRPQQRGRKPKRCEACQLKS